MAGLKYISLWYRKTRASGDQSQFTADIWRGEIRVVTVSLFCKIITSHQIPSYWCFTEKKNRKFNNVQPEERENPFLWRTVSITAICPDKSLRFNWGFLGGDRLAILCLAHRHWGWSGKTTRNDERVSGVVLDALLIESTSETLTGCTTG